jgi:hypothetical protein
MGVSFLGGWGRRLVLFFAAVAALALIGAGRASAATLNVCQSGCPYAQGDVRERNDQATHHCREPGSCVRERSKITSAS